jgi:uncharacterized protein
VYRTIDCSEQSIAHRSDHLERVMFLAKSIASTMEDIDNELLELAVLLHDVNQPVGRKQEHVELSMRTAKQILLDEDCSGEREMQVLRIISQHSTEHIEIVKPTSNEARILFDADKIDGLGAVGVARVFAMFGQMGRSPVEAIPWYRNKIAISLNHLQTEEGRRLFESRQDYVEEFLRQMESQVCSS